MDANEEKTIEEEIQITPEQKQIAKELLHLIQPYMNGDEDTFLKHLITEFALQGIDSKETENIFWQIYSEIITATKNEYKWADYLSLLDELYLDEVYNNAGLDGLSVYLTKKLSKSEALHCTNEIKRILKPFENDEVFECKISSENYILLNKSEKIIQGKTLRTNQKGEITKFSIEKIINAYPEELIIHDSPITDMGRTFSIKWESKTSARLFETKQATISELGTYLEEAGWVFPSKMKLKGILAAMIDTCITNDLATIRTDIDNPGFYFDKKDEKIIKVELELPKFENNLHKSFKILEELEKYASTNKKKWASVLKWGLVAPFSYAKKQMGGSWIPWLYLHGKARSGKTTMGQIILYLWGKPDQTNNIGGSGFDTPARVGEKLGISTLPLLVNEPEGALAKPSVMGLIKSAIESPIARGKLQGGRYKNLPSFAPVVMTANMYLPQEDSVLRRMFCIGFSHNEKKGEEEAKLFEAHFGLNTPASSSLIDLHYLTSFVYDEIEKDPSLLKLDWQELADRLLLRAYADVGEKVPKWLTLWYESASLEELDDDETENIRMFLFEQINKQTRQVKIYKENGYPEQEVPLDVGEFNDSDDFHARVWNVLANNLISWCGIHTTRDNKIQVYFTSGMKRDIAEVTQTCKDVKSISELIGWEYKSFRMGKTYKKGMVVDFDDFVEFLSPSWGEEE